MNDKISISKEQVKDLRNYDKIKMDVVLERQHKEFLTRNRSDSGKKEKWDRDTIFKASDYAGESKFIT